MPWVNWIVIRQSSLNGGHNRSAYAESKLELRVLHRVLKISTVLCYEYWLENFKSVEAVQSRTISPGWLEAKTSVCINETHFSQGPRDATSPFMCCSSLVTIFGKISSTATFTPCRSRAGMVWNLKLEVGALRIARHIPNRWVCYTQHDVEYYYNCRTYTAYIQHLNQYQENKSTYSQKWISSRSKMEAVHPPPLLFDFVTPSLQISQHVGSCRHSKRMK